MLDVNSRLEECAVGDEGAGCGEVGLWYNRCWSGNLSEGWCLRMATTAAVGRTRYEYESSLVGYRITRAIIVVIVRLLYRYRVTGRENVPKEGATILALNHIHMFDPGPIVTAVRRRIVTMAAAKWRDSWVINAFLRVAGTIYVRRGEVDRRALRDALRVLNGGGVLAVAPEGTRSHGTGLGPGKPGVCYLASKSGATIVPIAFWGIEDLAEWKRLHRPELHVVIGKPFRLPDALPGRGTADLQALSDQIMVRIGAMLPESYRGVYKERIDAYIAGDCQDDLIPVVAG